MKGLFLPIFIFITLVYGSYYEENLGFSSDSSSSASLTCFKDHHTVIRKPRNSDEFYTSSSSESSSDSDAPRLNKFRKSEIRKFRVLEESPPRNNFVRQEDKEDPFH